MEKTIPLKTLCLLYLCLGQTLAAEGLTHWEEAGQALRVVQAGDAAMPPNAVAPDRQAPASPPNPKPEQRRSTPTKGNTPLESFDATEKIPAGSSVSFPVDI